MALSDYTPECREIPFKGGSFVVSGITLDSFTTIIRTHLPDLEALFDLVTSTIDGDVAISEDEVTKLAVVFAEQAPGFVSNLIALAANESTPAGITAASKLPFPTQVKVLVDIVELTFGEVGGVKKALGSIAGLLKANSKFRATKGRP